MQISDNSSNLTEALQRRQEGFRKMYTDICNRLKESQVRSKRVFDLRRRLQKFTPGQIVWRRNKCQSDAYNYFNAKLAPKCVGPFKIRRKIGYWNFHFSNDFAMFLA